MADVGPRAGIDFPVHEAGTPGCFQKSIVCSSITTTPANFIQCVDGDAMMISGSVETDATGLAGMTNLVLTTDNAYGVATLFSQAITGLGANAVVALASGATTACTFPFVLELGKYILINGTALAGTGTGVIRVNLFYAVLSGAPYFV